MPTKYPQSFKDRATRMVFDRLEDEDAPSRYVVIRETAPKLSIATQTLRRWVEQAEVDTGQKSGVSTDAQAQIRKLKRENAELCWANEILKTALGFFRSGARPPHDEMIAYIDMFRDRFGVESICRVLGATDRGFITSGGYRAAKARPASDRSRRDAALIPVVKELHQANYGVYGVRKMWHAMRRAGWDVGRDQVARLMCLAGLSGVVRGRKPRTTIAAKVSDLRPDLVNRDFGVTAPNRLWVADITYVRTTSGFCYTAFVTDAFSRKIVGWSTRTTMRTDALPLEALEHALLSAKDQALDGLVHHSDRGLQYVSIRYTEHLAKAGLTASVGTAGDAYDNALAETVNGLYKTELIYARPAWPSATEVEFETMNWVHWWNTTRLHEALNYQTPTDVETSYHMTQAQALSPV
ncbi:IS3 family transposase [Auritidibacter ignavus]|uniref:IS3 family transposase n=1 Tax=Auritidibacter ignavus TaxID=678932 RepID=UPI00244AD02C|nr:IS3 family transposase [Auritidibacter ignavus]WGH90586.1 IS3 family transposase [Auritidibacter ignavus]